MVILPRFTRKSAKVFHINSTLYADKLLSAGKDVALITADDAVLIRSFIKERTAQRTLYRGSQNKIILALLCTTVFIPKEMVYVILCSRKSDVSLTPVHDIEMFNFECLFDAQFLGTAGYPERGCVHGTGIGAKISGKDTMDTMLDVFGNSYGKNVQKKI